MTPIEIPHEIDRFVLYFDTPERRVNAYALASSLIGLADAIREANTVVNPGYSVEVVVEALPDGSFQAVVRTVFSKVKNLFSNEAVKAIVYGIIATYIYDGMFKNDTPPQVTVDQHSVVITHGKDRIIVPRDVYEAKRLLEKSARFESAIGQVFHGAATDTTVQGQISFADAEYAGKRKKTRREVFLEEMELVVPWKALLKLIEPHYPMAGRGRRPYPLESMLRVHLMQNWFALSDPAMEEALYEIASLRSFARLSLAEAIPGRDDDPELPPPAGGQ
jgi:hypothetical protein